MLCSKRPRAIHLGCLDGEAPHAQHKKKHCPLCVKRRWIYILPTTLTRREGQSDEEFRMQRVNRYHAWHRCSCRHILEWQNLQDDGSLASDRRLLVDMNVGRHGKMQALPVEVAKSEAASVAEPYEPVGLQAEARRGETQPWSFSRLSISEE